MTAATVVHGVRGTVFAATRAQLRHRPDVLHYSWSDTWIVRRSRLLARAWSLLFRLDIRLARMMGARIHWTLDDRQNREPIHRDLQQRLHRWFVRHVDLIRVSDRATIGPAVIYLDTDPGRFGVVEASDGGEPDVAREGAWPPPADTAGAGSASLSPRRVVMGSAVRLLHVTGLTSMLAARRGRSGGVISYHNVVPTEWLVPGFPHLVDHGIAAFEEQLDILHDRYRILPADAAPDPRGGVVLSFDDGMLNNVEIIAPILAKRGLTAIFAVVAGAAVEEMPHLWRDHLYLMLRARRGVPTVLPDDGFQQAATPTATNAASLVDRIHRWVQHERIADVRPIIEETFARNRVPFERIDWRPLRFRPMNARQVKALRAAGHVIASHTWSHPVLTKIDEPAVRSELGRSREVLAGLLGEPVTWLVYPYGTPVAVSADVARVARATGYERAWMNVDTGSDDPMLRPRFSMPKSANAAEMSATISGLRSAWRHRGAAMPAAS